MWKDPATLDVTNHGQNQSESTRKISSVNKYPEVTEKVLHSSAWASRNASHYCLQSFCMHNGLSIYQIKHCKTFCALPHLAYLIYKGPAAERQYYYVRSRKKHFISDLQLNLQKHINVCCCGLKKIDKEKTRLQENWLKTKHFDFFWSNDFAVAHGISIKFGL